MFDFLYAALQDLSRIPGNLFYVSLVVGFLLAVHDSTDELSALFQECWESFFSLRINGAASSLFAGLILFVSEVVVVSCTALFVVVLLYLLIVEPSANWFVRFLVISAFVLSFLIDLTPWSGYRSIALVISGALGAVALDSNSDLLTPIVILSFCSFCLHFALRFVLEFWMAIVATAKYSQEIAKCSQEIKGYSLENIGNSQEVAKYTQEVAKYTQEAAESVRRKKITGNFFE